MRAPFSRRLRVDRCLVVAALMVTAQATAATAASANVANRALSATAEVAAATCSETTKFVEEQATNPGSSTAKYFGIRGATYTYNHTPSCGPVTQSFFIRAAPDYTAWVEAGTETLASDDGNHQHAWAEYRYFPAGQSSVGTYDQSQGSY